MARVGGVHTPGCGDQLQVPVQWQGLVTDSHVVVGNRASREGLGQAWAHGSCGGPGRWCTLLGLQNLPTGVYTTAEVGDRDQLGGAGHIVRPATGVSRRGLGGHLAPMQLQRPGQAASADPGRWRGRGEWGGTQAAGAQEWEYPRGDNY